MNDCRTEILSIPETLLEKMGDHRTTFLRSMTPLQELLQRRNAKVVFNGHFSCGKSTLLNALLQRRILPTDDLPETGVPCELRSASEEEGFAVWPGGYKTGLECSSAAIGQITSIYRQDGSRTAQFPARLELSFVGLPIPPDTIWVDAPGINDDAAMAAKARDTALDGDLLVWVLNSRQCLSEPEIGFLADVVAARGTSGIIFVLNVFLNRDDEASWIAFQEREWLMHRQRVIDHLPELGLLGDPPPILPVSARCAQLGDGVGFGVEALRDALSKWSFELVQDNRRQRVRVALDAYRAALEPKRVAATQNFATARAEADRHQQRRKQRSDVLDTTRRLVDGAIQGFAKGAASAGRTVAAAVGDSLLRDGSYEEMLNTALKDADPGIGLCAAVNRAMNLGGFPRLPGHVQDAIREMSDPPHVCVTVSDQPLNKALVVKGAIGGAGGGALLGPFALVGLIVGAGGALAKAHADKAAFDITATKGNILDAASSCCSRIEHALPKIVDLVDEHLVIGPRPAVPDPTPMVELEAVNTAYTMLIQQVERGSDRVLQTLS